MRKNSIVLLLLVGAATLPAQAIPEGDREFALSALHASRKELLDAVAGLSPAQWNFQPAPDRWSIAQIAEHLALTEDWMFERLNKMLAEPAVAPRPVGRELDQKFMNRVADRGAKRQAPKDLEPTGRWTAPAEFAKAFNERRERTLDFTRTTQAALRSHAAGPKDDPIDAYQWLLSIAAHTDRHVAQIKEVKADRGWPR